MKPLLFVSLFVLPTLLYGQQDPVRFLGTDAYSGFIIPHSRELIPVSRSTPVGVSVNWSRIKTSDRAWQNCNCYSRNGWGLNYYNYNNPDQLGSSLNLIYFAEPYLLNREAFSITLRNAAGITYLTRVYNPETNPENIFFSSKLSFFLGVAVKANLRLGEKYQAHVGLHYNHISNGGLKQPNKGMNFPGLSVGVSRVLNNRRLEAKPDSLYGYNEAISYLAGVFGNIRSVNHAGATTSHLSAGVYGVVLKPLSKINGLNLGASLAWDGKYRRELELQQSDDEPVKQAFYFGHHFTFGKLAFMQQFGYYLIRPEPLVDPFFQRYSLLYNFTGKLYAGTGLTAYGHVAEHLDVRLMLKF